MRLIFEDRFLFVHVPFINMVKILIAYTILSGSYFSLRHEIKSKRRKKQTNQKKKKTNNQSCHVKTILFCCLFIYLFHNLCFIFFGSEIRQIKQTNAFSFKFNHCTPSPSTENDDPDNPGRNNLITVAEDTWRKPETTMVETFVLPHEILVKFH